jgi:hypothetical protein
VSRGVETRTKLVLGGNDREIRYLNSGLDDLTLIHTKRKPFDVLAEGLISCQSRGERI